MTWSTRALPAISSPTAAGSGADENRKMLGAFGWNLRVLSGLSLIVGALLVTGLDSAGSFAEITGFIAVLRASINVFGGFLVTNRMLSMFRKKNK